MEELWCVECRAFMGSWWPYAYAQLNMSHTDLQVVEASGAGLAPELPPGLLDHVVQHHGQHLLAAGARAIPAHAEEMQGGGTGGAEASVGPCAGAGRTVPQGEYPGTDPLLPAEEGQTEEEPDAPVLPEADDLRHAHAEHQGDPEGGATCLSITLAIAHFAFDST